MKKIFSIILILFAVSTFSQKPFKVPADSVYIGFNAARGKMLLYQNTLGQSVFDNSLGKSFRFLDSAYFANKAVFNDSAYYNKGTINTLLGLSGTKGIKSVSDTGYVKTLGDIIYGNLSFSGADRNIYNVTNHALTFGTNNLERMRIDNAGLIGINNIAPTYLITGDRADVRLLKMLSTAASSSASGARMLFGVNDGAAMASGDRLGEIFFVGASDNVNTLNLGAEIYAVTSAAWSGTNTSSDLCFSITPSSTFAVRSELMRLTATNRVGILTTTPSYTLSFGGVAARTIGVERNTTAATEGKSLTIYSGGATSGSTDKNPGNIILSTGIGTGDGGGQIEAYTTKLYQGSATTDRAAALSYKITSAALPDNNMAYSGAVPTTAKSFITLENAKSGIAMLTWGDGAEYAWFSFTTAGVVTLVTNSTNVVNTQTNNKVNIIDGGTAVYIINEMGSTASMTLTVTYNQ